MSDDMVENDNASRAQIYRHILIQRCRHFGNWPSDFSYQDMIRNYSLHETDNEVPIYLTFGVMTFDPPSRNDPAQKETEQRSHKGPLLVDPTHRPGFWIGEKIIAGPDPESDLYWFKYKHADPGEVDFFIGIQCQQEVSSEILQRTFAPILTALVACASIYLEDFVVPVSRPQLRKLIDTGKAEHSASYLIHCMERPTIAEDDLRKMFPQVVNRLGSLAEEQQRRIVVAARRYVSSFGEEDPIDRYCDLWEAAEFLVKELKQRDGRRIRGNVVSRVAYAVAQQTGLPARRLNAAIGQLYNIRNDVVHNAVEEPLKLDEMTRYMEIVTVQTFRFHLDCLPHLVKKSMTF
jgi:Apea-like HEPN